MLRILLPLLICIFLLPLTALADTVLIEKVAQTYADGQSGLNTYQATVNTNQVGAMIERMTTNMPADAPRPQAPKLRKYWSRESGRSAILPISKGAFPYMREMIRYFSREFAIDPGGLIFPVGEASKRAALLKQAKVKTFETRIGDNRTISVTATFGKAVDLGNAFYAEGLPLPRKTVTELVFDIDPVKNLLRRMEIAPANKSRLNLQLRHHDVAEKMLPGEVLITAPDGSVDIRLTTEFITIDDFQVPGKQVRTVRTPERNEQLEVTFSDYVMNKPLPDDAIRALSGQ